MIQMQFCLNPLRLFFVRDSCVGSVVPTSVLTCEADLHPEAPPGSTGLFFYTLGQGRLCLPFKYEAGR